MATTSELEFKTTGIDISAYMVKDTERALAFYRDVLGLEPTTVYPESGGAEYEFPDGTTFGLFNGGGDFPWQRSGGVMFAVDDFNAAVAHARKRGATVHMEHESPVCFMAIADDSEGNSIIIHKRKGS